MHLAHTYVFHRLKTKSKQSKKPFSVGKLCSWSFRTKGKKKIFHFSTEGDELLFLYTNTDEMLKTFQSQKKADPC